MIINNQQSDCQSGTSWKVVLGTYLRLLDVHSKKRFLWSKRGKTDSFCDDELI